ncbi:MAG TPA: M20/M25/M40 family metallo-hydrolase [Solirubrobacteraceae bacterium]|nr:M20/M25/M40 family metallo-hydrolase [Solirubrobacteraceae bacterium]
MNDNAVRLDPADIGRTLDDLAAIGNRYAGSPGEAAARDYLLERFKALGLDEVRLEPFRYLGYEAASASCVLNGREFECHPLQYTATGEIAGQAVYLGDAAEADFSRIDAAGLDLAGKVVVVHSMFPFDLVGVLQERGIAGLVHVCETPEGIVGNFTGALYPPPLEPPWPGRPTAYPGVTISHPDGRVLISELSCGRPVEIGLSHHASYHERTAHNVVGQISGSQSGQVILSAHYDSQAEGPCVYDNGSGLASLLETARVLRDGGELGTIVLLASACEEIGVWGASAYVHAHAREMEDVVGMVNLDGIASAYPSERQIWCADAALLDLAVDTARAQGWEPDRTMNVRSTFSDHAPFTDAGVPACLIWRPDYPYYHSRGDVRELVDEHAIAQTAGVSATLAARLATGVAAPASRVPAA